MRIEKALLLVGSLIGKQVRVVRSPDKGIIGLGGKVVDETLNTLVIEPDENSKKNGDHTVAKIGNRFAFNGITVDGNEIGFRPEDRLKKNWKKLDVIMRKNR